MSTVERDASGRILPGFSLNPKGRTPGSRGKRGRELLAQLEPLGEALLIKAVAVALDEEPDTMVLRDLLGRCLPPAEKTAPIVFPLPDGTLAEKSAAVLAGVTSGELTTDEGAALAAALQSHARIVELVELEQRLTAVEEKLK